MSEVAKKIREMHYAETGMNYNVVFAFDGAREPWVGSIGTYSARGPNIDAVMAGLLSQLNESLKVKRRTHQDALTAIESALA